MKTTITPYLLKRRKTADGLYPVYLRITQNRSYSLYSTEIYIEAKSWNKKGNYTKRNWIKDHPSADAWNNKIFQIWNEINRIIDENEGIGRKEIVEKLNETDEASSIKVHGYAYQYSEKLKDDGKFNPYKQTRTSANKFKDYAGDVSFDEVTPYMLNDFQTWLAKDKKQEDGTIEKGNHPNTIASNMVKLKAVFKQAHREGIIEENPFDHSIYEQTKEVTTKKKALSIEQIQNIEALELDEGSQLWHVKNYFMFSFWNAGIRFTDLAHLKWENIKDGRLTYTMGKTGRAKDILLTEPAKQILSHYEDESNKDKDFIFPILPDMNMTVSGYKKKANSQNVIVNRKLKDLQKMAGIDTNISFHISRHSFARWAKAKGLSLDFIGKALAHSKRATTEQYLDSLSEYDADKELKELVQSR
ncbi:MAG: hypothetical protein CL670_14850 [Balneola sp.]|nr:hypothetical protein [Balneola sp.]|tara:strand:- start:213317 stop:214564 length:1248 start_codon:yes stop_codon:yes gene_type:complete